MKRAGELLGPALRRLKCPEAALPWLAAAWPQIVGPALASHTRPVHFAQSCLEISTAGKAWKIELEELKPHFCARINQAWGGALVREIKFISVRPGPHRLPRELNNDHTPFIRRKKKPT
jgi:predicted nucleic acid-binding Zn ribbon protein